MARLTEIGEEKWGEIAKRIRDMDLGRSYIANRELWRVIARKNELLSSLGFFPDRFFMQAQVMTKPLAEDPLRFAPRRFHKTGLRALLALLQTAPPGIRRSAENLPSDLPLGISQRRADQLKRLR